MTRRNLFRTLLGAMVGLVAPWSKVLAWEAVCDSVSWRPAQDVRNAWVLTVEFSNGDEYALLVPNVTPPLIHWVGQPKSAVRAKLQEYVLPLHCTPKES